MLRCFAVCPVGGAPYTLLAAGLGTYCATAKQNPQIYTVPVGAYLYFTSQNKGLHGIWLYDSDVPTFKITAIPAFQAGSNLGIKKDGQGYYPVSGEMPQSALTPFTQGLKASASTFAYDDTTSANLVLLRLDAQL